ncbi:hypothetical protein QPK87_23750 [Kamptonema cortianum]|nr:hypothetical protein [Oscillatoria laete-virens]MDK3159565.1 hypothetical protein [Kamptonema cortianum]MDL5053297.1 hypothetical protein [Oscillatoria laete-virens NRMC-F 0139]
MILAFANDSSVTAFDSIAQANTYCEAIDVENNVYVFLNEAGFVLKPMFIVPPLKTKVLFFTIIEEAPFTLHQTHERRDDLLASLDSGTINVEKGPSKVSSLKDIRKLAPALFQK